MIRNTLCGSRAIKRQGSLNDQTGSFFASYNYKKDPKVLQLIRLIYLFKISVWHTERIDGFGFDLLANKHSETMFISEKEIKGVQRVLNYLDSPQVLDEERKLYRKSFESAPKAPPYIWPTDLNQFLLYVTQPRCFDKAFIPSN